MCRTTQAGATPRMIEPGRPTWVRWQIVALLVTYSFMTWFNRVSMVAAYDEHLHAETTITPVQIGSVYTAFLLAYTICMTPGGWFIDRFGPWAALVAMGFGSALFCALTGAASYAAVLGADALLLVLLSVRSLMGATTAPIYPAASHVVSLWLPLQRRALANGLVQGAAAVGIACAFPVFGALMDLATWPIAFIVAGSVTALLALAWAVYGRNTAQEHPFVNLAERHWIEAGRPNRQEARGTADGGIVTVQRLSPELPLWRRRSLILLTLSYAAVGYVEYLFFHWVHYYFHDVRHLPEGDSRNYAAIVTLAMAAGMVAGGWIADRLRMAYAGRWSRAVVPVVGLCAGAGLMVLGLVATEPRWIVTWFALTLAAVGAVEAPTWTMAVELGGRHGGTAAAICNTGGNGMGLIAPLITPVISGWITRHFGVSETAGWQWAISLGGVIAVAGAVLWVWITPEETPRQSNTASS